MIGENSSIVGEEEDAIYLSSHKDIPFWKIILPDHTVTLKISGIPESECEEFHYGEYGEYMYRKTVHPEQIACISTPGPDKDCMNTLCLSYMYSISDLACDIAEYYNHPGRLQYASVNPRLKEIVRIDHQQGDSYYRGEITVKDGELRYWEDLSCFMLDSSRKYFFTKKEALKRCEELNKDICGQLFLCGINGNGEKINLRSEK